MTASFQCPYCKHFSVLSEENHKSGEIILAGYVHFFNHLYLCSNPDCGKAGYRIFISENLFHYSDTDIREIENFTFPDSENLPKELAACIPENIRQDFYEAHLIKSLSPKASATLARRCLQGMIRDFWNITDKKTLFQEIDAIRDRIFPETWDAIHAVREIGNFGAHMQEDVSTILDIEPEEAEMLLELIEFLAKEWYISREERAQGNKKLQETRDRIKHAQNEKTA